MDFKESNKLDSFIKAADAFYDVGSIVYGNVVPKPDDNDAAASKINRIEISFLEKGRRRRSREIREIKSTRKRLKKESKNRQDRFADSTEIANFEDAKENEKSQTKEASSKQQQKDLKKSENKNRRRNAAATALVASLESSRGIKNDLSDMSGEVTGDLMYDGTRGIIGGIIDTVKRVIREVIAAALRQLAIYIAGLIASMIGPIVMAIVAVILMNSLLSVVTGIIAADEGEDEYEINFPSGDGNTYMGLDGTDIDAIIANLYDLYNDPDNDIYQMGATQEAILRWALGQVGCAYDQNSHWNLDDDIYDCSSLVYMAFLIQGIDISNEGLFSAAEECRHLVNDGCQIEGELLPGDLLFYGGADNDRYLGVYHVAIYVGDGKMVEARNARYGVVYCDVRNTNLIVCARAC